MARSSFGEMFGQATATWESWTETDVKRIEGEIDNLKKTLRHGGLDRETRADIKQEIEDLQWDVARWYANRTRRR